jgi:hypothetical protein
MKPEQWIVEGNIGTSSKTIWAVMMGVITQPSQCGRTYDTPHDPDDFSRCWKLLVLFPEWLKRLSEVGELLPKWKPFVREWDKLEEMYYGWRVNIEKYLELSHKEQKKFKFTDGMYDFVQVLDREGMLLDGWIEDSPGSWHRPEEKTIKLGN